MHERDEPVKLVKYISAFFNRRNYSKSLQYNKLSLSPHQAYFPLIHARTPQSPDPKHFTMACLPVLQIKSNTNDAYRSIQYFSMEK